MGEWRGIKSFDWQGYEWISRPLWGLNHPNDAFTYYDENMVSINKNGYIELDFKYHPKPLSMEDGSIVMKPYGRGSCRCTTEFKYGEFEWEMKLPYGKYLWPALWLSSDHSWPPEIDCMEGWSKKNPNYVKRLLFKNIHPTMHWSENGVHCQEDKKNILRCWIKGGDNYDKYKIIWTPNYVEIFYNGHLVNTFKNKKMLEEMNKPEVKFHPIMSTGPYEPFTSGDYEKYRNNDRIMTVKSFNYKPI